MEVSPQVESKKLTPHFFFTTLGMVVTLIVSAVAFLNLIFETLTHAFPDVLNATYQFGYNTYSYEGIRAALATVIIAFPVYLFLGRLWKKYVKGVLSIHDNTLKKWVLYLVVFLVSLTAFIDLIVLVKYFVSGEITLRFILKVLSVIVICSLVGAYYLNELKASSWKISRFVPWIGVLVVLGGIVYSFNVIGSPMSQRQLRLDQRRIEDLQSIQWQIINFWQQKEKLPDTLASLLDPLQPYQTIPKDPEFEKGKSYEYKKLADKKFELCATFSKPIPKGWQEYQGGGIMSLYGVAEVRDKAVSAAYPGPGGVTNETWNHDVGRTCFERTIDPERYPPFPKN